MQIFKAALVLVALTAGFAGSGRAQIPDEVATLEIRPGWRQSDGTHMAALDIGLAEGWKTYWRSPGDGGIPPRLMLEPNANIRSVRIAWPVPQVFFQNGLRSVGYTGGVILPLAVTTLDGSAPVTLKGRIEIGVCEDICIPVTFPINIELGATGQNDPAIRAALADRPMRARDAGVGSARCTITPIADGLRVAAEVEMPRLAATEASVLELTGQQVWISEAETLRTGTRLVATAEMVPPDGQPFALDRSAVRITVIGGGRAVDIRGCSPP
ncbi:MAG: protein-disulfide reductase DsbD domain-containing protein [Pseudomonadota bacterium]